MIKRWAYNGGVLPLSLTERGVPHFPLDQKEYLLPEHERVQGVLE
jgi:hypothetical protein